MEKTKVTKKEMFMELVGIIEGTGIEKEEIYLDFLKHEIDLLEKKALSRTTAETAKQKENNVIIEKIYMALEKVNRPVTITELQTEDLELAGLSNQKISALLKKLLDSGRVDRIADKKKAYFKVK